MQKGCPKDPGANRRGNSDEHLHSDWNGFIHLGNAFAPQCIVLATR